MEKANRSPEAESAYPDRAETPEMCPVLAWTLPRTDFSRLRSVPGSVPETASDASASPASPETISALRARRLVSWKQNVVLQVDMLHQVVGQLGCSGIKRLP